MTPKEKAQELVNKFSPLAKNWDCYNDEPLEENNAKQCAIIALQEMIELLDELPMNEDVIEQFAYLQEVKQEIKKL